MNTKLKILSAATFLASLGASVAVAQDKASPKEANAPTGAAVNFDTYVRAETDVAFKKIFDDAGMNTLSHNRTLTPIDKQNVVRMNRDTLYSFAVLDLSKPATVVMPKTGERYQSLQVISQDHYSFAKTKPGSYELTQKEVGTQYAYLIIRTFIDANDPEDIKSANAIQDQIEIKGGGDGPLDIPEWNMEQLKIATDALNTLAKLGGSNEGAFGTQDQVKTISHLVFTAAGWGGLPLKNTFAFLETIDFKNGAEYVINVKDVPVDAFWSVTVYDEKGFIPENSKGNYSYNNVTAKPNDDGSYTIHLGGCDDDRPNCLPISDGWDYVVRMYEPRPEILDGTWKFPKAEAMKGK
jgi:hypothetical protein